MMINLRMSSIRMKKMTMQVKMVHKKKVMAMMTMTMAMQVKMVHKKKVMAVMTITMAMQVKMAFKKKVKAAISKSDLFPTVAWSATTQPSSFHS